MVSHVLRAAIMNAELSSPCNASGFLRHKTARPNTQLAKPSLVPRGRHCSPPRSPAQNVFIGVVTVLVVGPLHLSAEK
jgi:hypothetical protein